MNVFFTSYLHFWHKKVIEYCNRPFATVEEMNEGLIERWNGVVGKKDSIFILGDFAFCNPTKLKEIIDRLNGYKHLVMGNHDWRYKSNRWKDDFGFEEACDTRRFDEFNLSHFPYKFSGDHGGQEERYTERRLEDDGGWLLHGHVHNAWKKKEKQINVGVDVWDYKPVSLEEIRIFTRS